MLAKNLSQKDKKIAVIGAGKMGAALTELWVKSGFPNNNLTIYDPNPTQEVYDFVKNYNIKIILDYNDIHPSFDFLFICIKPQILDSIHVYINKILNENTIVVSILAGKTVFSLKKYFKNNIVRAMPNLPAITGFGATSLFTSDNIELSKKKFIDELFGCTGLVNWVKEESVINKVTALSGSGPAYVLLFLKALIEAGQKLGLDPLLSEEFSRQTLIGTSALIQKYPHLKPDQLIAAIASKGGTTEAALKVLDQTNFFEIIDNAIKAAETRAIELS